MKNIKLTIVIASFLLFLLLSYLTLTNKLINIDFAIIDFIDKIRNNNLTFILKIITFLGGTIFLILFSISLLFILKNNKEKINLSKNLIIITLLNIFLKNIIKRNRPLGIALILEDSYSFPSGHAMISSAFYLHLINIIKNNLPNNLLKTSLIIITYILIISICFSRIYLGVHYFSDVICGLLFAISYSNLFDIITKKAN
ncbi:MAG: phosphatase PAP2 family protein [Bacilli bacterium]|nr:phosphatase PAP2 family protein [Bacilli bacterium]